MARCVIIALALLVGAAAKDPASSWLSYAGYTDPDGGRITALSCSWTVPSLPTQSYGSNAPGWWFGIQTAEGDGMLIQPILAYGYEGNDYSIFNGVYDWNKRLGSWWTSSVGGVQPGDRVNSYLKLIPGEGGAADAYEMYVGVEGAFEVKSTREVDASQSGNEAWAMFVLEHQPESCAAYPPDGAFTFENIYLEVEFEPVDAPDWKATQEVPACDSQATVVDAKTITISWDPTASAGGADAVAEAAAAAADDDKCCVGACEGDLSKYYSIDTRHNMCGECCMLDSDYNKYHLFEPGLTKADNDSPCLPLGFPDYDSTVTHGALNIKMTLDLYNPANATASTSKWGFGQ